MELHTGIRSTILEGVVLQGAFAALVTNRAIEGMVEQSKFQYALLPFYHLVSGGFDHHIRRHIHGAGGHQLRHLLDFYQAHPATTQRTDLLVIAENRDLHIDPFCRVYHLGAFGNRHRFPING